jgi:general secretion pathway protein H
MEPGVTMIEILIALALVGLLMGGIVVGVGAISQTNLRTAATRTAAAISFLAHEAVIKGRPTRLVMDLGQSSWRAEIMADTDEHASTFLISKEKQGENEDGTPKDEEEKKPSALKTQFPDASASLATAMLGEIKGRPKPTWEAIPGKSLRIEPLSGEVIFSAIYTPHQTEPFTQGAGYLYFWPSGQTEHALLHVSYKNADENDPEQFFSIIVDPITGRAKVSNGRAELPSSLTEFDAAEEQEAEDDTGL